MSVVGGQPKKHANPSYKATKHIERTFLISDNLKSPGNFSNPKSHS